MKMLTRVGVIFCISIVLLSCGAKKLAMEDYNRMAPQERIAYLEERILKNPDDPVLKKQLFQEHLAIGNRDRALAVMEDYLRLDPYQVDTQFEYGKLRYENGDYNDAYRAFLNVMQSSSADLYLSRVSQYVGGSYILQQLTATSADEAYPNFSPDGKKIIYQKRINDNWDIYEFSFETKTETALLTDKANEELPVFSPDGKRIVFASTAADRRPINDKFKVREINRMETSDKYIASLTRSFADDWLPKYSHNGEQIVFVSDRDDLRKVSYVTKQSDVYIMENDGDFQLQLTKTPATDGGATFSADDKYIFFHSDRNGNFDIMKMRKDGSQQMTVVDSKGNDVNPDCSPDGQYLVYVSDRSGNYEIYRSKIDGSADEQLTFSPAVDSNPVYSPDGRSVLFHSNRNGNYDIFLLNFTESSSGEKTVAGVVERLQQLIN